MNNDLGNYKAILRSKQKWKDDHSKNSEQRILEGKEDDS